ncbi:hypothetical protein DC498_04645 [Terrimonas sp.]|uniref:hypothetical protein n=1 Tax=Terrimonas sp. TaxID=1914338 RepID=UPI00092ACACC|nr:hypothetical protein [Terrimonas sp.]OJY80524.1 MAG: hypothetical protein BGP13_18000 [Sphingobacteriales bacterium 40-81]PVD53169.1 hypothetical protein DC498_04645 [Terrimonas sp.]
MKKISILLVAFLITAGLKAQQNYHFVSQQHQSVKYDSASNAYFIEKEVNQLANINVTEKNISFTITENNTSYITLVKIENAHLDSLEKKMSFSVNGVDSKTGRQVKLGFWFIGEELDEVNYTELATQTTIGYKDLSVGSEAIAQTVAVTRPVKARK